MLKTLLRGARGAYRGYRNTKDAISNKIQDTQKEFNDYKEKNRLKNQGFNEWYKEANQEFRADLKDTINNYIDD